MITTPPGVYLLSYALSPITGCELAWLRSVGLFSLTSLFTILPWTYGSRQAGRPDDWQVKLSAFNMTLFPPLFFFCALYYTDVASTMTVVMSYCLFVQSHRTRSSPLVRRLVLVSQGSVSLLFRQTNIFWVAIFPAGIVLVDELDIGHQAVKDSMHRRVEGFGNSLISVARTSWKMEVVYDLHVADAWLEGNVRPTRTSQLSANIALDYVKTCISICACGLKAATQPKRLQSLVTAQAPFLALLQLFAGFVLWNGGVVLGDKSNHVATIHLPQILYTWPLFIFFSWPLAYPYIATLAVGLFAKIPNVASMQTMLVFKRRNVLPRLWVLGLFTVLALLIVHLNTIVHPFTLADNRHYTFYVFRLLLRPWWVRYVVTPVYVFCGWASIQTLGTRATPPKSTPSTNRPNGLVSEPTTQPSDVAPTRTQPRLLPHNVTSPTTSLVLIWLATTSLQLVTAPLVEPRYFILPWIFWRMHIPLSQPSPAPSPAPTNKGSSSKSTLSKVDHKLLLETAWLLLINALTGYIFLSWEFTWPQEPGKAQRFMW